MTTQPTQPENNDTQVSVAEDSSVPNSPSNTGETAVPASTQAQDNATSLFTPEAPTPSFTALVEEFRQREERMALQRAEPEDAQEGSESAPAAGNTETPEPGDTSNVAATPATKQQRLVPPPLRPATRIRTPRHGGGRQRETFVTHGTTPPAAAGATIPTTPGDAEHQVSPTAAGESTAPASDVAEQPASVTQGTTTQEAQREQAAAPKPARRYRFDRREPAAHSVVPSKPLSLAPAPAEPAGGRVRPENIAPEQVAKPANGTVVESSLLATEAVAPPESEVTAPAPASTHQNNERRRRHGNEGQRDKAQGSTDATKDAGKADTTRQADAKHRVPTGEIAAAEQAAPQTGVESSLDTAHEASAEIPLEDLPPLEYSELQAASRRRRHRRTNNNSPTQANRPTTPANGSALPTAGTPSSPIAPVSPVTPTRAPSAPPAPYTIQSGMTVNQMNQGIEVAGPFQGPEPTPARGSVLPSQPRLTRQTRNVNEVQRGSVTPLPTARTGGDGILSTAAVNHLANVISQAIQTQTDRMVTELRRTNQTPANVSVTMPSFPSTERVGVFVDVANLLYSARTLRTTIDFGKLLDFLRGNRRLVRAHAYTPTSPQPGDDQMFLQAVKGLGYRITTKNYKTFSSGAKKADMDLDLCMDVVRLVDGKAVDTVVLVSGDSDFIPLLDYCSDHGVRVEVVAFDESMSASLRQSCDLFINLSMLDEIRVS